ncbi:hypothetical protein PR202_ga20573 [Eleusine coracana subsp. coracana]|uniref:RNase H type-1 domain-containing protein n=1 Tax=Eleusine coracana subsp. coracana TaxID=191504 RepID=A0AAV5CX09_ELECO|nr:hypothetical protein PR202_ga20573 [Eleusine coracana subsp. coracana]
MTRSESATVEEGFIGRASAPIAGTSNGSCAQMKMRIRSLLAGALIDGKGKGAAAAGVVIRDERGSVLLTAWRPIRRCTSVEEAEAKACLEGVRLTAELVRQPAYVESDCSTIIQSLRSASSARSSWEDTVQDIRASADMLPDCRQSADRFGKRFEKENLPVGPACQRPRRNTPGRGRAAPPVARHVVAGVRPTTVAADRRPHAHVRTSLCRLSERTHPCIHSFALALSLPSPLPSVVASAPRRLAATARRSPSQASGSSAETTRRACTCFPCTARSALGDRSGSSPALTVDPELFPNAAFTPSSSLETAADHRNPHPTGETAPPASLSQEKLDDLLLRAPVKLPGKILSLSALPLPC